MQTESAWIRLFDSGLSTHNRLWPHLDAAKVSPDFPGLLESLGPLYEETGRLPDAARVYLEGAKRFPSAPEFPFHLGVIHYRSGRVDQGIAELRRAVEMNQQYFDWFSALFTAVALVVGLLIANVVLPPGRDL